MTEDTSIGGVTWHSSEDDGGPDVGISVYLGDGKRLWCGEISRSLFDECGGSEWFDDDGGWFLVVYGPKANLVAKVGDKDQMKDMIEMLATAARDADVPTLAKMIAALSTGDRGG